MSETEGSVISKGWTNLTGGDLSQSTLDLVCIVIVILISGIWALMTFDKLAPISEGWYVVYSEMILAGKVPYVDFELVFPPLYAYMMASVTAVFGESLFVLRVIGALLFVGTAVLSYYLFKLIFPSWISAIAAVVSIMAMQSDSIFISHDYIFFFNFFNYMTFYIILRAIVRSCRKEPINLNMNLFFAGASCAIAILFRHSTGLMVLVYMALFLVFIMMFAKNVGFKGRNIICFLAGVSIPMIVTAVLLANAGALMACIEMTLFSGAKGGVLSILFGWIYRLITEQAMGVVVGTALALCFIRLCGLTKGERTDDTREDHILCFVFLAVAALLAVALFHLQGLSSMVSYLWSLDIFVTIIFVFNLVMGAVFLYRMILKIRNGEEISLAEIAYLFFCGFFIIIGWGAGTSVNITPRHIALCFGFVAAVLVAQISKVPRSKLKTGLKTTLMAVGILFLAASISTKVVNTYDWWGLETEPYSDALYETDIPYFNGIKLTANEKYVYEDFVEKADLHLGGADEMYCYSQIPIFYSLAGKLPTVKTPVPWFDVASDQTVLDDLEYLKANNPKLMVFADHGEYVMEAQEKYYRDGGESGQRKIYEWLSDCRDGLLNYTVLEIYEIQNYKVYLMLRM